MCIGSIRHVMQLHYHVNAFAADLEQAFRLKSTDAASHPRMREAHRNDWTVEWNRTMTFWIHAAPTSMEKVLTICSILEYSNIRTVVISMLLLNLITISSVFRKEIRIYYLYDRCLS